MAHDGLGLSDRERSEVERANTSGLRTIVFVHGLWLLAASWAAWQEFFAARGFAVVVAGWPHEPESIDQALALPELASGYGISEITNHVDALIAGLDRAPAIIGHSFGGLVTQQLAGRGLAAVSIAIDPAPGRGVYAMPRSALKAAWPVLRRPGNRKRSVMLSYPEFRFAFANAVAEAEAQDLYARFAVPGTGQPVFQAAEANINPKTEAAVDVRNPARGPMLFIAGEDDNTVPWAIVAGAYRRQHANQAPTEIRQIPGRGHSLVIDSGWEKVAKVALEFVMHQWSS